MTRGNQRELARERNMKKKKQDGKKEDGLTVEQRKFRDAELMREKQRRKDDDARKKAEACNKK